MTETELASLLGFLTGGLLVGIIGHWLDQLVSFIKRK